MDGFYIGNLKGDGPVWEFTAVDTATRWAMVWIIAGAPNGILGVKFLEQVIRRYRRLGVTVSAILTDNGLEWRYAGLAEAVAARASSIPGPRRDRRTTTPSANGSTARSSTSSGAPPGVQRSRSAPNRSRCLAHQLQPPPRQPRRLHARTDTRRRRRRAQDPMTISHKAQPSPRTPDRKS
jgi:hypothetical protein